MIRSNNLHVVLIVLWLSIASGLLRAQQPFASFATSDSLQVQGATDTIYWYPGAILYLPVVAGPAGARLSVRGGKLSEVDKASGRYMVAVDLSKPGGTDVCVTVTHSGKTADTCVAVVIEQPALKGGISHWKGMGMMVGRKYNPSSKWENKRIPEAHYHTIVEADGQVVLDSSGTRFRDEDLPSSMIYRETTRDLKATVYWKPGGTQDRNKWVALVASYQRPDVLIPNGKKDAGTDSGLDSYSAPQHVQGFDFVWVITPKSMRKDFGPIVLRQKIDEDHFIGVDAHIRCQECADEGVNPQLIRVDDTLWTLYMGVDPTRIKPTIDGKQLYLNINMTGRGGVSAFGTITVLVSLSRRSREN
jgi:hypothetical protein